MSLSEDMSDTRNIVVKYFCREGQEYYQDYDVKHDRIAAGIV